MQYIAGMFDFSCELETDIWLFGCHFVNSEPLFTRLPGRVYSALQYVFFPVFKPDKNTCLQCLWEKIPGGELSQLVPSSPQALTLLNQQIVLTHVLKVSFPVLMKSALLLVGNVMEKMTVGIILMKMDVVSKNYFKHGSNQFEPGWSPDHDQRQR